jgi:hypothetical protein
MLPSLYHISDLKQFVSGQRGFNKYTQANRQRSRDPRVAVLLRALCDTALRYNFSFSTINRAGEAAPAQASCCT